MSLFKPEIKITIEEEKDHFVLVLLSDVLAKNVYVDCSVNGKYSDNYFDLIPGEETTIEFYPDKDIENISFTAFSLWDALEKIN
jgi:beta-mannosidase